MRLQLTHAKLRACLSSTSGTLQVSMHVQWVFRVCSRSTTAEDSVVRALTASKCTL